MLKVEDIKMGDLLEDEHGEKMRVVCMRWRDGGDPVITVETVDRRFDLKSVSVIEGVRKRAR